MSTSTPVPDPASLTFPPSDATVSVKLIRSFLQFTMPSALFLAPAPGSTSDESAPLTGSGKAFLVERADGTRVVFDLGCRKDLSTAVPAVRERLQRGEPPLEYGPDVAETLAAHGVDPASVSAVIWSHSHFDHAGNPDTFSKNAALVVGPGTQAAVRPGWPKNPDAMLPESDFEDRKVVELSSFDHGLVGGMPAHDYFGDGSFYLLDAPGHCIGHMLGLARVTSAPPSFVLMAGDTCHHPGMLRPSAHVPLPSSLHGALPAALRACARDVSFLALPLPGTDSIHADARGAAATLACVQALDARADVLVVLSHDRSVDAGAPGGLRFFPDALDAWRAEGVKERMRWLFLEKGNAANRWERV